MSEINPQWERETLEKIVLASVREQRAARRWKIAFRIIWLLITLAILGWIMGVTEKTDKKISTGVYTASISMAGEIGSDGEVGVIADEVISALREAFADSNVKGVILRANSPGGSPVASGQIYDEIRALRKQYPKKPIYTVVDDLCASGCYYAAAATDKIFVNRASLIGSIGVLMNGFGFTGAMEKLGVERRLITAGQNKGFMDPFSPLNPQQKAFTQNMLEEIHQQFIAAVREGRGNRLHETPEIFSGLIWNGVEAVTMGLVDGQGTSDYVARELIKAEDIVDFTHRRGWLEILVNRVGTAAGLSFKSLFASKLQ